MLVSIYIGLHVTCGCNSGGWTLIVKNGHCVLDLVLVLLKKIYLKETFLI